MEICELTVVELLIRPFLSSLPLYPLLSIYTHFSLTDLLNRLVWATFSDGRYCVFPPAFDTAIYSMAGLLLSGLSRRHDSALYLSDLDRRCLVSSAIATELHDGFFRYVSLIVFLVPS